jgi:hypothetical protein
MLLPGTAGAQSYTLTAQVPSVQAGNDIEFVGSGFREGERVGSWATAPDGAVLGGDEAEASGPEGSITLRFYVPGGALGGRWAFTVFGDESRVPVVATFEVVGRSGGGTQPQAAVEPAAGPPGTSFAFAGLGFSELEQVSYWVTAPDGEIYAAYPSGAEAEESGRVDFRWTAPTDAPRGVWVMTMQGIKSNTARGVRFEVR